MCGGCGLYRWWRLLDFLGQTVKWADFSGVSVKQFVCSATTALYFDFFIYVFFWFHGSYLSPHLSPCPSMSMSSGLQGKPLCWAVLVQDRQIKVLLSSGPEIYILDDASCREVVRQTNNLIDTCRVSTSIWKSLPVCLTICLSSASSMAQFPDWQHHPHVSVLQL